MAIGGKYLTTEVEDFVYFVGDPAIDANASDFGEYARTGSPRAIKLLPGATATKFHVSPLDGDRYQEIREETAEHSSTEAKRIATANAVFMRSVWRVEDYEFDDGTLGDLPRAQWTTLLSPAVREVVGLLLFQLCTVREPTAEEAEPSEDDIPK